jgi:predicted  nucleic acid-binding Zn-ribbon protein
LTHFNNGCKVQYCFVILKKNKESFLRENAMAEKKQRTIKELEKELREAKREIKKWRGEVESAAGKIMSAQSEANYARRELDEAKRKDQRLLAELDHRQNIISSQVNKITNLTGDVIRLETASAEMQKRLDESWDKKQAEEVIGVLLEELTGCDLIRPLEH